MDEPMVLKKVLTGLAFAAALAGGALVLEAQPTGSFRIWLRDEGVSQGRVNTLDFTGTGVSASVAGSVGTVNVSGGGGGAPTTATYITQTADATLSAEQNLDALGTGLLLNTTGTGVLSAYAGTSCTNQFPRSLSVSGSATCASVSMSGDVTGTLGISNGGTGQTTNTAAFNALAPGSTAKGDLLVFDGTNWVRFPNGAIGQFLRTNTNTSTNLEWTTGPNLSMLANDATSSSNTVTSVVSIGYSPAANTWFGITCNMIYQTAATTTGLSFAMYANNNGGTAAPQYFYSHYEFSGFGAAGTDDTWGQSSTTNGGLVTTTGVNAATTDYLLHVESLILTHATATDAFIVPLFRSEVNLSQVTIHKGSYCLGYVLS